MVLIKEKIKTTSGSPLPYGCFKNKETINLSITSSHAKTVSLFLFKKDCKTPFFEKALDPKKNKTGDVWHIGLMGIDTPFAYGYSINGSSILQDPYSKEILSPKEWSSQKEEYLGKSFYSFYEPNTLPNWSKDRPINRSIKEMVIYEMHIRGFTQDSSSQVKNPGTFLGVIEKIDHLKTLGINTVELLPVFEFYEDEYPCLCNYWGYSPVGFFSLMNRYHNTDNPQETRKAFQEMVLALHQAGIEVLLDVVFNHTAEKGEDGLNISLKGIDPDVYYMYDSNKNHHNFSGCGNTLNTNHPRVIDLIIDSLRYWVLEMHIDGFRFDLASILTRLPDGTPNISAPLIEKISSDPVLKQVKLIAEPWDASGLYQVGEFAPKGWMEWNGMFRDDVRRFIKGDFGQSGHFATRLSGSFDLYGGIEKPEYSLNFITSHDGFTLNDLVSYNQKHNLDNQEKNRDGQNQNDSWNCGVEGKTDQKEILSLRERQKKNLHLALMLSLGTPMILMGDEYSHTKEGNNNTWCQDNEKNWFLWDQLEENKGFFRFFCGINQLRNSHKIFKSGFLCPEKEILWHGQNPLEPNWSCDAKHVCYQLQKEDENFFIAFNSNNEDILIRPPTPPKNHLWHLLVLTSETAPLDFIEEDQSHPIQSEEFSLKKYSALVLKAIAIQ